MIRGLIIDNVQLSFVGSRIYTLDVFDEEPLPAEHPLRVLGNVVSTSHIGYVTENTYKLFYGDTVRAIED